MSCITKILELKGDKEVLEIPNKPHVLIEAGGNYKGYEYLITLNNMCFRCGYVAVPPEHPTYKDPEEYPDYDVHGGVTFFGDPHLLDSLIETPCADKWIGFDAGHAGDAWDFKTALRLFSNKEALKNIICIKEIKDKVRLEMNGTFAGHKHFMDSCEIIRTKEYMAKQCEHLIDQIITKAA